MNCAALRPMASSTSPGAPYGRGTGGRDECTMAAKSLSFSSGVVWVQGTWSLTSAITQRAVFSAEPRYSTESPRLYSPFALGGLTCTSTTSVFRRPDSIRPASWE